LWAIPEGIQQCLAEAKRVRMVLATPAFFTEGWKPGWLNGDLVGSPPGSSLRLKLVGACVERWRPVSGWSLEPPRGPKAIRRMVPAGSVYFFEVVENGASGLNSLWLESVSDEEQARNDGFGLALWGLWNPHEEV
ncbi:MAG: type III-B CRISPR module-associated Cmr3 family protein, partial [Armatimonadota bacterium]